MASSSVLWLAISVLAALVILLFVLLMKIWCSVQVVGSETKEPLPKMPLAAVAVPPSHGVQPYNRVLNAGFQGSDIYVGSGNGGNGGTATAPGTGGIIRTSVSDLKDKLLSKRQPGVVAFIASWCGACKAFYPTLERAAKNAKMAGIPVYAVEISEPSASELFQQYKVSAYPTLIRFDNGKVAGMMVGGRPESEFISWAVSTVA